MAFPIVITFGVDVPAPRAGTLLVLIIKAWIARWCRRFQSCCTFWCHSQTSRDVMCVNHDWQLPKQPARVLEKRIVTGRSLMSRSWSCDVHYMTRCKRQKSKVIGHKVTQLFSSNSNKSVRDGRIKFDFCYNDTSCNYPSSGRSSTCAFGACCASPRYSSCNYPLSEQSFVSVRQVSSPPSSGRSLSSVCQVSLSRSVPGVS